MLRQVASSFSGSSARFERRPDGAEIVLGRGGAELAAQLNVPSLAPH
jgi:hypothetical protein